MRRGVLAGAVLLLAVAAGCQLVFGLDGLDDQRCRADEKPCVNLKKCVKKNDPNTGCGSLTSCTPCALPHSVATCEFTGQENPEWQCKVVGCERNWGRCAGQVECETDLQHDPDHCGDCTTVCPSFPNAFRGCSGSCTIGGCKPGFADCNREPVDGCEANLTSEAANCGRCGGACATSCQSSVCL